MTEELIEQIEKARRGDKEAHAKLLLTLEPEDINDIVGSAKLGDAYAQSLLATCYINGYGVAQDFGEAIKWLNYVDFEKWCNIACEQCYADTEKAIYDSGFLKLLGDCYFDGIGLERDQTKAFKMYRVAAIQGNADAIYKLGVCYANGYGVLADSMMADKLFKQAASLGQEDSKKRMDKSVLGHGNSILIGLVILIIYLIIKYASKL